MDTHTRARDGGRDQSSQLELLDVVLGGGQGVQPRPRVSRRSRASIRGARRIVHMLHMRAAGARARAQATLGSGLPARETRHDVRSVLLLLLVIAVLVLSVAWVFAKGRHAGASTSNSASKLRSAEVGASRTFDLDEAMRAPMRVGAITAAAPDVKRRVSAAPGADLAIGGMAVQSTGTALQVRVSVQADAQHLADHLKPGLDVFVLLLVAGEEAGRTQLDAEALARGDISVLFELPSCRPGPASVVAIVDPAGVLPERDERNNVRMRDLDLSC